MVLLADDIIIKKSRTLHNGGNTTQKFKLKKDRKQGNPISAYLFILVLEIAFLYIEEKRNIKGLNISDDLFLCSAQADNTACFQ